MHATRRHTAPSAAPFLRRATFERCQALQVGYTASIATWRATPAPVAPFGSSKVAPLVVGNLFDQVATLLLVPH